MRRLLLILMSCGCVGADLHGTGAQSLTICGDPDHPILCPDGGVAGAGGGGGGQAGSGGAGEAGSGGSAGSGDCHVTVTPGPMLLLWPPNHKYHVLHLSDCANVTDSCAGASGNGADTTGRITAMSSDEPENSIGDGNTMNDMVILGPSSFEVRAEREGTSNGRVYTIHFDVTDSSGAITHASCQVGVPHDQSGAPPIDDGAAAGYTIP
jgi:hypothetical protein